MKSKLIKITIILLLLSQPAFAGSINTAAYKTMQAQSYRSNYNRNIPKTVPYWQMQSNYATRSRSYQDYYNRTRNINNPTYTNYGMQNYRGRY